jgi:hypothetical protein
MTARLWAVELPDGREAQGWGQTDAEAKELAINLFQQMMGCTVTRVTSDGVEYQPRLERYSEHLPKLPPGPYSIVCFRQRDGSIHCRRTCSCADPSRCSCGVHQFGEKPMATRTRSRRYADQGDIETLRDKIVEIVQGLTDVQQLQQIAELITSDGFGQGGNGGDADEDLDDMDSLDSGASAATTTSSSGTIPGAGSTPFGSRTKIGKYGEKETRRVLNVTKFSEAQERTLQQAYADIDKLSEKELRMTGDMSKQDLKEVARLAVYEGSL